MNPKAVALSWYWRRLKRMPFAEFPYRISHALKRLRDKRISRPIVRDTCSPEQVDIVPIDFSKIGSSVSRFAEQAQERGDQICDHQFAVFGEEAFFGTLVDWHLDPKTGRSWPMQFWGDINYRDGQTIGGIKFAWELNRLHHFPQLALAAVITGDEKYQKEIFAQLRSWMNSNPYPLGINWASGIELGIRIVNLVYTLKILPGPIAVDDHRIVSDFIYLHATHLHRYPSKYSSAANHAIAEALGLFIAGISFPGFKASTKWKRFGKRVLENEVCKQIYPDGSSFEHSFPYLQFVVDHYLIYMLICREHGEPYSQEVSSRIETALQFIDWMLDRNGNFPAIGDDDSGYLLKLWFGEHNNFRSLLRTGSTLFDQDTSDDCNSPPDLKSFLLLWDQALPVDPRPASPDSRPRRTHKYFSNAGLAVVKSHSPMNFMFVGNSGPLGLPPLAGHGHADALSFWLSVEGQPVFIDPGTYLYHSGGVWRDYFRSTAAHNTIRIDATDQAKMISDFMFDSFYDVYGRGLIEEDDKLVWTAMHNGYERLPDPVLHRRTVTIDAEKAQFKIADDILCQGPHAVESFFHLHPCCDVELNVDTIRISNGSAVTTMHIDDQWQTTEALKGQRDELSGWFSKEFNSLCETVTLRLKADISCRTTFITVIDCSSA